jgi:hypothetical protein
MVGVWSAEKITSELVDWLKKNKVNVLELPQPFGKVDVADIPGKAASGDLSPADWLICSPFVLMVYCLGPLMIRIAGMSIFMSFYVFLGPVFTCALYGVAAWHVSGPLESFLFHTLGKDKLDAYYHYPAAAIEAAGAMILYKVQLSNPCTQCLSHSHASCARSFILQSKPTLLL